MVAKDIFSDDETQRLILAYMYGRSHDAHGKFNQEAISTEDTKAFLNACLSAVLLAQSIKMVADGLLLVQWDKDSNAFEFAISPAGSKANADNRSILQRWRPR